MKFVNIVSRVCCFLFLALALVSCSPNPDISFYYWKTSYYLSQAEKQVLKDNEVKKIYIRYFDIDIHPGTGEPYVRTPIYFVQKPELKNIVPVINIKNKVFLLPGLKAADLADQILKKIQAMNEKNQLLTNEIQIDCDWTADSRTRFQSFMKELKQQSKGKISATIRLQHVKYAEKMGVPAVDYGVLMYYNMGAVTPESDNSIYNRDTARNYVESLEDYPMPLNVALPIYAWGVQIRNHKIVGLRSKLTIEDLQLDSHFSMISDNEFKVNQSNYRSGVFYKKGDLVKIEAIKTKDLKEMTRDLSSNLNETPKEIIFYDLDEANFKNFEPTVYKLISKRF